MPLAAGLVEQHRLTCPHHRHQLRGIAQAHHGRAHSHATATPRSVDIPARAGAG